MDTSKNYVSFLSGEEQVKFNSLFLPRKLQDENSNENELDDLLLRKRQRDSIKVNLYKYLITETNNSSFYGLWIDGAKGDGISWLSEKILQTFLNKQYTDCSTPKLYILKEDKEATSKKLPEISDLIGKRQFINCAKKSGLMKKSLLLLLSIICTLLPVVFGIIANASKIIDFTSNLPVQIIIIAFCILGVIGIILSSLKNNTEKRLTDFLDTIHNTKINEDPRYIRLIQTLAGKISSLNTPRILVIDDFSALHELSRNVLQKYYESKYENPQNKELWIILNTNLAISEQSKSWNNQDREFPKFQYAKLLTLKLKEKRELVKQLELPQENSTCDVLKDICCKYLSPTSLLEIKGQIEDLQKRDEDTFRFLYLIASNAFPSDMEFKREALIEKMRYTKKIKERDKYIPEILKKQLAPDEQQLQVYFEQIQKFLRYYGDEKFRVRNNVIRYITGKEERTNLQANLYHYSNGYWAMCWYFVFGKKRWKISWIPKLAHHLKSAYCIDDNNLRKNMFDAHLLAIEKSMKYFLRKEIIDTIESALRLNIQEQDNVEDKLQQLVTYIAFAFFNFDYLPERKKLKEIGYELLYDFLKKDDLELARQLLNSEKYDFLSDEIIYVLIERCWEKVLFLHISDKRYTMRNAIKEIDELQSIIKNYLTQNNLQNINDTGQEIRNIALWLWINIFNISTNEFEKKQYDELVDYIENLIFSFTTYSEQHINCRNDIELTMLYTTMQGNAYIIIASILMIKATNRAIKNQRLEEYMQEIIKLYRLKININDNMRAFDDVMKLIQLQSLMWRQGNYITRYYLLSIIRVQLYSCWNIDNSRVRKSKRHYVTYTIEDEQKYKFKDELGIIETKHHLNTVANFTLCNLYFGYGDEASSNYFQKACNSIEGVEITKSQLEYMFMCLIANWRNGGYYLKKVIDCFIRNEKQYINDILFYFSTNVDTSYTHLINTLEKFKDDNSVQFFTRILKELKQNNTPHIEEAEAIWKNFEFGQMNEKEKLKNKKEYESFWIGKEQLFPYSEALGDLLVLEQSDELKNKIFTYLTREDLDYNDFSGHLDLACYYLFFSQENKNDKYYEILEIVQEQEKTTRFKNCLSTMYTVYDTLENCTAEPKYSEALIEIKLKLTNNKFDNQLNVSAFDFLCHLCNVWLHKFISYEKIDSQQYIDIVRQNFSNKKKFISKYNRAPEVFVKIKVNDSAIDVPNAEFILINQVINSLLYQEEKNDIIFEYQNLINDCNGKATENLDQIISLIMVTNPNYTEQIQRLKEQWEEQIVYDGEEDDEEL